MAKLSPNDWLEIKTRYELGHNVRKIADDYKYDAGNLVKKAKKEGWEHGTISKEKCAALENEKLHQEFNQYINVNIDKLKIIYDIFKLQSERGRTQIIKIKDRQIGIREKAALDTIEQIFNIKLSRQFQVGGFRIDGYDAVNKIAYEIDEEQHNSKKHSQHDVLRQKFIEEQLGCIFKRIKV